MQTPQYFYNLPPGDPFGSDAPLFYGPIVQGKDGWDGDSWEDCSNQTLHLGAVNGYAGYIDVTTTATSSPSLDDLTGEEFGIAGNPPPPPNPVPVGGYIVPVSKLELLAPWIGLAALMAIALAAVVVRRRTV